MSDLFVTRRHLIAAAWPLAARGAEPLRVGPGRRFSRIGDALAEAADGDTVLVDEGEYAGDTALIERKGLTVRALGRGAVVHADGRHVEGKASWVVRGEATIENIEFRGARVPSGNGAGIRFERGHLVLRRCRFFDNENGLLAANEPWMTLSIEDSEFGAAPRHMGLLHHLLYVGGIGRFSVRGSRFSGGFRGHLLKSRAFNNDVRFCHLADGPGGEASYELELPNGGIASIVGNVIVQSETTQNPALLSVGAEARPGERRTVVLLAHNTLVNHGRADARFVQFWRDRLGDATLRATNNVFAGPGSMAPDGAGNVELPLSALVDANGHDYRLARHAYRNAPAVPTDGPPLDAQFTLPRGTRPLRGPPRLAGALQPAG